MIELDKFTESVNEFDKRESRTNFFTLAKNLINNDYETEGFLLILTTWNFAIFRYAIKQFDIENFEKVIKNLEPFFDKFRDLNFSSINLDKYRTDIEEIYNSLSKIKGVEYTGAPKLMHLKNPNVFVMWDSYIRGEKSKKYYEKLEIIKDGTWEFKKYPKEFEGYFEFLKDMQIKFKNLEMNGKKTLAKAIDEFNYVNITLEIQSMEKDNKKIKKKLLT